MSIAMEVDARELAPLFRQIGKVPDEVGDGLYEFAVEARDSVRKQLISQQKEAPRNKLAGEIEAKRVSKLVSTVNMPQKAIFLDSAKPHFVSLRRGRLITEWASKYYSGSGGEGKSQVWRGKQGGITGGYLYVTPDPFIEKGLERVENRLMVIVNKKIKETLRR